MNTNRALRGMVAACVLAQVGCYHFRASSVDVTPPGGQPETRIQHSFLWGNVMSPQYLDVKQTCPTGLMQEVTAEPKAWQLLVGAVTLGIYFPVTMKWVCGKFPAESPQSPPDCTSCADKTPGKPDDF